MGKKGSVLKRIAFAFAFVLIIAVSFVVVRFYVLFPKVRPAREMTAPTSADAVERGRYLANNVFVCMGCHSGTNEGVPGDPVDPNKLGAGHDFDLIGFPGHVRAPNLTPDPKTGIAKWSDGEIVRAMREGISKNGRVLFPIMPYPNYAKVISDDDALAVVAYLRTLKPIEHDPGETELQFPLSMFIRGVPAPVESSPAAPPPDTDKLARGRWLLKASSCTECHTPQDDHGQPVAGKTMAGGLLLAIGDKGTVRTSNITSDKETGLGEWSDAEVRAALESGTSKDGRPLYAMPWSYFQRMTEADKTDLVAAIREIPAVHNEVAKGPKSR
jgi:mono/diheme cytochrome c family protein